MILFIKSIIIGICAVLPGVSGSVIAVSLGIYEKFIYIISDYKRIKENKKFIFTVLIGIILGIYLTSFFLIFILQNNNIFYFALLGIIMSEIPLLVDKIKSITNKNIQVIPCVLSFIISIILSLLNNNGVIESSPIKYFVGGILFSFGKIFPGVSSSFLLLCLGIYENIILIVMNPFLLFQNFTLYIPFILGAIIGIIIFILLLRYLLEKKYRLLYSIIIGLILSSIFIMIPNITIMGLIVFFSSFIISYYIKK